MFCLSKVLSIIVGFWANCLCGNYFFNLKQKYSHPGVGKQKQDQQDSTTNKWKVLKYARADVHGHSGDGTSLGLPYTIWHLADQPGNGSLIGTISAMISIPGLFWVLAAFHWNCADLVDPLGLSHCLIFWWDCLGVYKLKILILLQNLMRKSDEKMYFSGSSTCISSWGAHPAPEKDRNRGSTENFSLSIETSYIKSLSAVQRKLPFCVQMQSERDTCLHLRLFHDCSSRFRCNCHFMLHFNCFLRQPNLKYTKGKEGVTGTDVLCTEYGWC